LTCLAAGAPTKTWNLAGLHTSWVHFSDVQLQRAYLDEAEPAALTFGSVFATEAMAAAYTHGGPWLREAKVTFFCVFLIPYNSLKQINTALTLANAQIVLYTSN